MLMEITIQLEAAKDILKQHFLTSEQPEEKKDPVFFDFVKKKTEPLFDQIECWEEEALRLAKNREISVHPQLIQSTRENFELILMHSFYIDVKLQRYMELHQAIDYVFLLIKNDIAKQ
ncbi:protein of unknown function [Amphibacillus marinus]|uniref:DUF1798 family protein n=1 Tax=Amphibacillus marinus TaxID=872970 RepID=A0A1H8GJJ7_9BACI|nr:DUF1798 family protein [Amphibacillus marinus]SEN44351.1 protein of unknown function [Amphibacillus marinus]